MSRMDWLQKIVAAVMRARTNTALVGLSILCLLAMFLASLRWVDGLPGVVLGVLVLAAFVLIVMRRTSRQPPFPLPANYAELAMQHGYFWGDSEHFHRLSDARKVIELPSKQASPAELPPPPPAPMSAEGQDR